MVYLFLEEGFEECEALIVKDLLTRAKIEIKTVSSNNLFVTSSHGVVVKADMFISDVDLEKAKMLVLPGGMPGTINLNNNPQVRKLVKKANDVKLPIAAICAAPLVLASCDLLHGKPATIYPGMEDELGDAIITKEKVVVSDNIITSRGLGTAIDFALKLIEILTNKETSDQVKSQIVY